MLRLRLLVEPSSKGTGDENNGLRAFAIPWPSPREPGEAPVWVEVFSTPWVSHLRGTTRSLSLSLACSPLLMAFLPLGPGLLPQGGPGAVPGGGGVRTYLILPRRTAAYRPRLTVLAAPYPPGFHLPPLFPPALPSSLQAYRLGTTPA